MLQLRIMNRIRFCHRKTGTESIFVLVDVHISLLHHRGDIKYYAGKYLTDTIYGIHWCPDAASPGIPDLDFA